MKMVIVVNKSNIFFLMATTTFQNILQIKHFTNVIMGYI